MSAVNQPSATSAVHLQSASNKAQSVMDNCVVSATKKLYESKMKSMRSFFVTHGLEPDLKPPFNTENVLKFFGSLANKTDKSGAKKPLAISTMRLHKSALKFEYRRLKVTFPLELDEEIETFLDGYVREISVLKQTGKMKVFEGKLPLSFTAYCMLAQELFTWSNYSQMMFGWCFIVLQWNLLARSESVANVMLTHVSWEEDALVIATPKSKSDQEGAKCFGRHLYANPSNPVICPILAFAILTFSRVYHDVSAGELDAHDHCDERDDTDHLDEHVARVDPKKKCKKRTTQPISQSNQSNQSSQSYQSNRSNQPDLATSNFPAFEGSDTEGRFAKLLRAVVKKLDRAAQLQLGCATNQIGTHSVRKGAATYCTSLVSGPATVQVFLRAGWTLGPVQDRYLFGGGGGDQLTGRVLAGLSINDRLFSTLPPHFDSAGLRLIAWNLILPAYEHYPVGFQPALPFLLASIVFHQDWLRANLNPRHPLFSSFLFTSGQLALLKSQVFTGVNNSAVCMLTAHGIPPHIAVSNEVNNVAIQASQFHIALMHKCDEIPVILEQRLNDRFTINGVVPLTRSDMEVMLSNHWDKLKDSLISSTRPVIESSPVNQSNDSRFDSWTWGGEFHMVPQGWHIPKPPIKETWNLWYFGDPAARIRPLRHLQARDLANEEDESLASRIRGLFSVIISTGVELHLLADGQRVENCSLEASLRFFDQSFPAAMEKIEPGITSKSRWSQLSVTTMYKKIIGKLDSTQRKRLRQAARWNNPQQRKRRMIAVTNVEAML